MYKVTQQFSWEVVWHLSIVVYHQKNDNLLRDTTAGVMVVDDTVLTYVRGSKYDLQVFLGSILFC